MPKGKGKSERLYMGKADDIGNTLSTLPWDENQQPHTFQIDHKQEIQLGGADLDPENLWLLDARANMRP